MLKNNPDIFALCETNLHASRILDSNCLTTCQSIARMLGICTASVFMLRAIFRLPEILLVRMKTILICVFVWLFYILLPSYFSCIVCHLRHLVVVEAVSSNIDKAVILQPSANIVVCGDFNAHKNRVALSFPYHLYCRSVLSRVCCGTRPHPDCGFSYSHS